MIPHSIKDISRVNKEDVGLGNVDNTSDANKPISTATQTALNGKANSSHSHAAGDVTSGTFAIARIPTGTTSSTVCIGNDSRLSDARTPTSHTHAGTDITSGTVAYARLPVGTAASTVCAGDDSRLSDARTPKSHTHAGGDITSGTVAYARLPVGTAASTVCAGNDGRLSDSRTPKTHASTHNIGGTDAIATASASSNGLLSSTNWSTFNNKQNALPTAFLYIIPPNANLTKSSKDDDGVYRVYTWTLTTAVSGYPAKWVSTLSNDYLTRTMVVYGDNKSTVLATYTFTRTLDTDGNLVSEVLQ